MAVPLVALVALVGGVVVRPRAGRRRVPADGVLVVRAGLGARGALAVREAAALLQPTAPAVRRVASGGRRGGGGLEDPLVLQRVLRREALRHLSRG